MFAKVHICSYIQQIYHRQEYENKIHLEGVLAYESVLLDHLSVPPGPVSDHHLHQ